MFSKLFFFHIPKDPSDLLPSVNKAFTDAQIVRSCFIHIVKLGKGTCEVLGFCVTLQYKKGQEVGGDNS